MAPKVFGQILKIDQMGRVRKHKRLFRSLTFTTLDKHKSKSDELNMLEHVWLQNTRENAFWPKLRLVTEPR